MLHEQLHERRTPEEKAAIRANQSNPMPIVLADLPDEARPFARIVGRWVWVEFTQKPDAEVRECLTDVGFRWNSKRKVWQHSCGSGKSRRSPTDPRFKYGEVPVDEA